jgi:transposase
MDGDPVAIARMHERHAHFLQVENNTLHRDLSSKYKEALSLRQENAALKSEKAKLKRRVEELTRKRRVPPEGEAFEGEAPEQAVPAFVKPNVADRSQRRPGRKKGHVAALRPRPRKIDVKLDIALPVDGQGKRCCPHCRTQLGVVKHHLRLVEDIVPSKVVTTCYRTHSGYCPSCRKRIESRAEDQPPAANLPHAQLGINAMATATVMRVCYRLPLRQVTRLFEDLPGLTMSPAAVSKQLRRLSHWLSGQYDRLQLVLRAAGVVHADETGWRTNGKNGYLWTLTNAEHTLYHVDRSRGGKVIAELLGEAFGGTLVSDFYAVYDQFDCPQQKCLTHLLRELRDTVQRRSELKSHTFFKRCKQLVQEMLRLKRRKQGLSNAALDCVSNATSDRLPDAAYGRQVKSIETRLRNLGAKSWDDADADRLAARLRKYQDRLTTFLHDANVDGTNNAAERALRPAVVMRKITGGSRSESGAEAWAILASVMRTAQQQGRDVVATIKELLLATWAGRQPAALTDSS